MSKKGHAQIGTGAIRERGALVPESTHRWLYCLLISGSVLVTPVVGI
jgi:hypothetical protein